MISNTKYELDDETIKTLFQAGKIGPVFAIAPLGAGEYNAVYAVEANDRAYVLKVAPLELPLMETYERRLIHSELFWYQQIREKTSIRVPEIFFIDFTRKLVPVDYFIMERLPGQAMDQMEFSPEEKAEADAELVRMLAQIHSIHSDRFGYVQNQLYDDWYQAIRSMVKNILGDLSKKRVRSPRGAKLLRYIDQYQGVLEKVESTMVDFDLGRANILCERVGGRIRYGLIDPERGFWGDRVCDFFHTEMFLPLDQKKATLAAYNAVAETPVIASREEVIRHAISLGYVAAILEAEKIYHHTPMQIGWLRSVFGAKILYKTAFGILENG